MRDHIQPVEQIFAEPPCRHFIAKVLVRGAHHTHVHAEQVGTTHPPEFPGLKEAEQFGLDGGADIADLIQERAFRRWPLQRVPAWWQTRS